MPAGGSGLRSHGASSSGWPVAEHCRFGQSVLLCQEHGEEPSSPAASTRLPRLLRAVGARS